MNDVLRIGQPAVAVVDPHLTTDRRTTLAIREAQFEALVRRDAGGSFRPALATGWDVGADARTWTVRVRSGVRFHDGERLGAEAVVQSIARVRDWRAEGELGTTGVIQGYLHGAEVAAVDDATVRILTAVPLADLLDLVVDLPIVSAGLAGTGRYRIEEQTGEMVTMAGVPDYWGGGESPGRVVWSAIPEPEARVEALLGGQVDLIADLPRDLTGAVRDRADLAIREQASPTCVAFLCNCFAGPCADQRVRVALNVGLDVPALIEAAAHGDGEPLDGPLTPLHFGHDPGTPRYQHDPERARRLLAAAGLGDGLHVTVDVPLTLPDEAPALARAMAAQWAEIGIQATIREHADREGYALRVRAKEIGDAACFDSSPLSSYRVLREKLHSSVAGPWWQGYTNPDVDGLLDRAAETTDDAERQAVYRQAYRLVRNDAPWVFLYRPMYRWSAYRELPAAVWRATPSGVIEIAEQAGPQSGA